MFVCLLDELILGFCYSDLTLETGGLELTSTITLILQANRLTKCGSDSGFLIGKRMKIWIRKPKIRLMGNFPVQIFG